MLLTVSRFAELAGVSTQAIYQRLAKDLQRYCKVENGHKYIDSDALSVFGKDADLSSTLQAVDKQLTSTCKADSDRIAELMQQLDAMQARLHEAEQAAAVAAAERDAERRRADGAQVALVAALESVKASQDHAQQLADALTAAQQLHAGQLALAMHSAGDPAPDEVGGQSDEGKTGFFARLFRKNK